MIRALTEVNGQPMVFLGLSGENITRLIAGEPIMVNMNELGLPPLNVVIMYGKTERAIAAELMEHGFIPPSMAADLAEAESRPKEAAE